MEKLIRMTKEQYRGLMKALNDLGAHADTAADMLRHYPELKMYYMRQAEQALQLRQYIGGAWAGAQPERDPEPEDVEPLVIRDDGASCNECGKPLVNHAVCLNPTCSRIGLL